MSHDIGTLGPRAGQPVAHRWGIAAQAPRMVPWLALLALLCVGPNRDPRAWAVLVPPLLAKAIFIACERMAPAAAAQAVSALGTVVLSLCLAMGLLWEGSFALVSDSRRRDVLLTLAVLIPGSVLAALCASGLNTHARGYAIAVSLLGLVLLLSLLGAGFGCRRTYTPGRYVRRLCVSCVAGTCAVTLASLAVTAAVQGFGFGMLAQLAIVALVYIGLVSAILVGILLSYLALPLWNSLYRERFYAAYRLPGMPGVDAAAGTAAAAPTVPIPPPATGKMDRPVTEPPGTGHTR